MTSCETASSWPSEAQDTNNTTQSQSSNTSESLSPEAAMSPVHGVAGNRISHSVSTDSFFGADKAGILSSEAEHCRELLNNDAVTVSPSHTASVETGSGTRDVEEKGRLLAMEEWEQASKNTTTWGVDMVLQRHQQQIFDSDSMDTLGIVPLSCSPPSGAGCKRPRQKMTRPASEPALLNNEASPQDFLWGILEERGYETSPLLAKTQAFFRPPTAKQVTDYDIPLVTAVRTGDLGSLRDMAAAGRQMDACNRFGESIVHISCRRGQAETLRFLLENGGRVHMCDDLGRTPLHDACWAKVPVFDCVSAIMDQDPSLIRVVDCRGATPLSYIRREHWPEWREFFDSKKEKYWAPLPGCASQARSGRSNSESTMSGGVEREPRGQMENVETLHSSSAAKPVTATSGSTDREGEEVQQTRTSERQRQRKRSKNVN
ncbi:hypothetical protein NSK_003537 [Nannochloropsis salina CCMP1776]|uniref:Uncharacterized protein n=1 Tax=Nannochloropsis salina CCMP1776 TaxID=1027361 RepID=A0A4D9D298_9STRA|nr:hypothetical protein NSK_003537 [Nannochloropsis salina CCMP1776]|eukprot:TFJ85114.1 hypothetical protein NSK_003537 [Nannochloropsis salina CCMP1776]